MEFILIAVALAAIIFVRYLLRVRLQNKQQPELYPTFEVTIRAMRDEELIKELFHEDTDKVRREECKKELRRRWALPRYYS